MISGVPVINGGVIAAEGQLEIVIQVVADDQTFEFEIEARRRRSARPASDLAVRLSSLNTLTLEDKAELRCNTNWPSSNPPCGASSV